jgi:transcriptional regulator with XRE-family HTH domain
MINYAYLIYKLRTVKMNQTQAVFAQGLEKRTSMISMWENGVKNPSRESLEEVAAYVKMPLPMMLLYGMDDSVAVPMVKKYFQEQNIKL